MLRSGITYTHMIPSGTCTRMIILPQLQLWASFPAYCICPRWTHLCLIQRVTWIQWEWSTLNDSLDEYSMSLSIMYCYHSPWIRLSTTFKLMSASIICDPTQELVIAQYRDCIQDLDTPHVHPPVPLKTCIHVCTLCKSITDAPRVHVRIQWWAVHNECTNAYCSPSSQTGHTFTATATIGWKNRILITSFVQLCMSHL